VGVAIYANERCTKHILGSAQISEGEFHNIADEAIENVQDAVEALEDDMEDLEVDYAASIAAPLCPSNACTNFSMQAGVLNIVLGPHGTWVINKQTPNRQIWWSSPIRFDCAWVDVHYVANATIPNIIFSGPIRFEHDATKDIWLGTRDGQQLNSLLTTEIKEATGHTIEFA
jgi:frataxin